MFAKLLDWLKGLLGYAASPQEEVTRLNLMRFEQRLDDSLPRLNIELPLHQYRLDLRLLPLFNREHISELIRDKNNQSINKMPYQDDWTQAYFKFLTRQSKYQQLFKLDTLYYANASRQSPDDAELMEIFSEPLPPREDATPHLMILTEVCWKTLGDYYAAHRLIGAMKNHHPTLRITWMIICSSPQDVPHEKADAEIIILKNLWDLFVVNDWKKAQIRQLRQADFILQFPTFHHFPARLLQLLAESREKDALLPIYHCLEYDYEQMTFHEDEAVMRTGFAPSALGIFFNAELSPQPSTDPLCKLSGKEGARLRDALLRDSDFERYRRQHQLFVGYRNKDIWRLDNRGSVFNFIAVAIALSKTEDKEHVDIVLPFLDEDWEFFAKILQLSRENLLSQHSLTQRIHENVLPLVKEVVFSSSQQNEKSITLNKTGMTVRLINPFPLNNANFLALMQAGHPFKMCTGDQSLSDCLSMHALVFYQAMNWKRFLFDRFLELVESVCGPESLLMEFLKLQHYQDNANIFFSAEEVSRCVELLRNPELSKQMQMLCEHIERNKNLYNTLPQQLGNLLDQTRAARTAGEQRRAATQTSGAVCFFSSTRLPDHTAEHGSMHQLTASSQSLPS